MEKSIFGRVFLWLFIGLGLTFVTALYVSTNENMVYNIFSGSTYFFLFLAQIIAVIYLSARINKMSVDTAKAIFIGYSILTGVTFAAIFIAFDMSAIVYSFGISAAIFAVFALLGFYTNIDLTKIRTFLFTGLIIIILGSIINIFLNIAMFDFMLIIGGIVLFMAFIAYDIQKIKHMMYNIDDEEKMAIYGALQLYLDFINLFIRILRLVAGSRK
jgi:uncharacterized protein